MKRLSKKAKKFIHSAVLGSLFFVSCQNLALGAPYVAPWSESESAPAFTHVVDLKTETEDGVLLSPSAPSKEHGTRKQLRQRHPWRTVGLFVLGVGAVGGLCVGGYFLYPVIFGAGATYFAATTSPSENSTQTSFVPSSTDRPTFSPTMDSPEWEPIALQCPPGMKEIGSGSTCRSGETSATHNWGEPWLNSEISAICSEDIWLNCAKSTAAQGCPSGTHPGPTYDGSFRDVFGRCEWEGSRQFLPDGSEAVVCENGSWHQCDKDPSTPKPTTTTTTPKPTTTTTPKPTTTTTSTTTTTPRPDLRCPRGMKKIGSGAACRFGETSTTHNWGELWKGPAVAICPKDGVWRLCADRKGARGCPSGTHPGNTYDGNFRAVFWQCELENYSQSLPCQEKSVVCHDKSWTWCDKDPSTPKPTTTTTTPKPTTTTTPKPTTTTTTPKPTTTTTTPKPTTTTTTPKPTTTTTLPPKAVCPAGMQDRGVLWQNGQNVSCNQPGYSYIQRCGRTLGCGNDKVWHICLKSANTPKLTPPYFRVSAGSEG